MQLSIIIPYYNRAVTIERTLRSIANQSHRPLELLLVNNNSTDRSEAICREFKSSHEAPDFRILLLDEPKVGANPARNRGLATATSDYISFYDSDDTMDPQRMELIHEAIVKGCRPDLVGTISTLFDEASGKRWIKMRHFSSSPLLQLLRGQLATQNMTIRAELLREIGGWDERIARWQDWNLGVRLLLKTPLIKWVTSKSVDTIYLHEQSITGNRYGTEGNPLLNAILFTLEAVERHGGADRQKLRLALLFRLYLLAALLEREGEREMCQATLAEAKAFEIAYSNFNYLFRLLNLYTRYGGRGAWRVAYYAIQIFG